MTPQDYAALREQVKLHEGVRLKPYRDTVGKLTIGVGRNLDDRGITAQEADDMLTHDLVEVVAGVAHRLPWVVALDSVRQRAIYDLAFNVGLAGLLGFPKMLEALRRHDYHRAADELLDSRWATQVQPARRDRLVAMLRTGVA